MENKKLDCYLNERIGFLRVYILKGYDDTYYVYIFHEPNDKIEELLYEPAYFTNYVEMKGYVEMCLNDLRNSAEAMLDKVKNI